jgi:MYXO-CTERM domain-containing protein
MHPFFKLAVAPLPFLLLAACNPSAGSKPVTMADSFDLDIFGPHVDDLHTPYVAGAQFGITVDASTTDNQTGWALTSSNPSVLRVLSPLVGGSASVAAGAAGSATISVVDSTGKVLDSHPVTVEVPDQVGLYAEGLLLTGASDAVAQVTQASVVAGGEATFLVRYFSQGTELYGSGALQTTATGGLTTTTTSATFATARDFLEVTAPAQGTTGSVSLMTNNIVVGQIPITEVAASAVTQVAIIPQSTSGAQSGTTLILYAHAADANATDVYGASFNWFVTGPGEDGGLASEGLGNEGPADLFFYTYDPSVSETVTASYESFSPSATVHGHGGSVGSTASFDMCSLGRAPGAGGTSSAAALGLALAGAFVARRRRNPRRPR